MQYSQGNVIKNQGQALKNWEKCTTELCDWAIRSKNLDVEPEEEIDTTRKKLTSCTLKCKKAITQLAEAKED